MRRAMLGALFAAAMPVAAPTVAHAQGRPPRADSAQKLPTTTVKDAMDDLPAAFVRRSRLKGGGKFLTAKDVAAIAPANTAQLLARVSGGNIRDIGGGVMAIVGSRGSRQNTMATVENELCMVALSVNEVRVVQGFEMSSIRPENIVALEFYRGPSSIPLELGGTSSADAGCGLVALWVDEGKRSPQLGGHGTTR